MKFYAGVALVTILIAGNVSAQQVNIGIKGGANFYNINNDNNADNDTKIGFHAGLLGHIHVARHFAIQPELVYSSQGAKYTIDNIETKMKLGYINVPVMFQYMFDNGFRLQAGPQLGFLINAERETANVSVDIKENLKSIDLAVGIGAGYVNPATGFGIDARYNLGLSDINETGPVKSTNRGFQVGVFYLFKHK